MDDINSSNVSHSKIDIKFEKTIYKRRSSVFQSRPVAIDDHEGIEESAHTKEPEDCISEKQQEEFFDLNEYITSVKKERKEWIEMLIRRKTQRRNLTKKKLYSEAEGQPIDLNVLRDSEKAFVTARPNYQHICKYNNKLFDMASKVSTLNQLVYKLNERFILQMERRLHKVTKKIIETSES